MLIGPDMISNFQLNGICIPPQRPDLNIKFENIQGNNQIKNTTRHLILREDSGSCLINLFDHQVEKINRIES